MRNSRVAVVYAHPLFGRGIARLLRAAADFEVTCFDIEADVLRHVRRLRPHAIILEACRDDGGLRDVLGNLACLVIRVAPEDNVMDVHHNWQLTSAQPETLVTTLRLGLRGRND